MFVKAFRLRNLLCGLAAVGIAAAIVGNLAAMGVRALNRPEGAQMEPSAAETIEKNPEAGEKVVYLSFDDGPSAVTGEILDVLKEKQVPATFFVIGATTERGKALYQRIIDEGHALGIHSYSHRYGEIYESADAYLKDFERLSDHLEETVGVRPSICRFPGGSNNRHASKETLREIKKRLRKKGVVWFDWNAIAKDDRETPAPAEQMFETVVKTAGEKERILVLLHDDALRTTAAECVSMLIDHYRELGYRFEKLTSETDPICFG